MMESLRIAWGLMMLFAWLAFPQLVGVLIYFRLRKYTSLLGHILGVLAPPVMTFYVGVVVFIVVPSKAHAFDHCGTPLIAIIPIIYFGTFMAFIVAGSAQLILRSRYRHTADVK